MPKNILRTGENAVFSVQANRSTAIWEFGDDATVQGLAVNHQFAEPGSYNGRVIFNDACGIVEEAFGTVVEGPLAVGIDVVETLDRKDNEEVDIPNPGDSINLRPIATEQPSNSGVLKKCL